MADTFGSILLFVVITFGLGWPIAARLTGPLPEKLLASSALSLLGVFLFAWAIYVWALPLALLWILPVAAVAALGADWRFLRTACRDSEWRELAIAQFLVTSWCIGWLALVVTYSGGTWVGDWFGHWQRAVYFLEHGPRDVLFNGFDPLTSRPPLANLVTGAFMTLTRNDFAHYQLAMTFFGSLAFLPAALLARRCGGRRAPALLASMLMLSPMFVQNATFAWTKLPAAFFTLAALHYFLRFRDSSAWQFAVLCAATLAAALLTHYSAGPYAVLLATAWIFRGWGRRRDLAWWKATTAGCLVGTGLLATWFGWALAVYGVKGALLTTTTVTDQAPTAGAQWRIVVLNVRDTLVPHFLRDVDYTFFAQQSPWGSWRDWFFQLYQLNLFFALGSIAWLGVAVVLLECGRTATAGVRAAWILGVASIVLLGIMAHGGRDGWGLAHICLQPLVLAGLSVLAGRWETLGAGWRWTLVVGATLDFALGIALQFGAQSFLFDQWFGDHRFAADTLWSYSTPAAMNLRAKLASHWTFFGDNFAANDRLILMLLGALLLMAILRARRRTA